MNAYTGSPASAGGSPAGSTARPLACAGSSKWRLSLCGVALALLFAMPALPQCQMCRTAAAAQQEKAAKALNAGIVVLGLPPVAILLGLGGLAYRYRNQSGIR